MFVKPYFVPYNKTDCIVLVIKRQLFLIFSYTQSNSI